MELNVHGKQMDVGDALRTHVEDKLEDLNEKFLNHAAFATVTFSKEGHGKARTKTNISIQLGKNIYVVADSTDADPYAAFDTAADKVGKQMRRYKRKLRDHHERQDQNVIQARDYVLAAAPEQNDEPEAEAPDEPLIVAEMTKDIETMSVSEAVMRLDLSGEDFMVFINAKNSALNVIHRREDGNIGWIDPENGS